MITVNTIYIGRQNSIDASESIVGKDDIKRQMGQVLKSLQAAFDVFQRLWGRRSNPPVITMMLASGLANPEAWCKWMQLPSFSKVSI